MTTGACPNLPFWNSKFAQFAFFLKNEKIWEKLWLVFQNNKNDIAKYVQKKQKTFQMHARKTMHAFSCFFGPYSDEQLRKTPKMVCSGACPGFFQGEGQNF